MMYLLLGLKFNYELIRHFEQNQGGEIIKTTRKDLSFLTQH